MTDETPTAAPGYTFASAAGLWRWHLIPTAGGGPALCGQAPGMGGWRAYAGTLTERQTACPECMRLQGERNSHDH